MKRAFMNLKLSYRLFLIIIALFLVPYLALFSWSNAKAEKIIKNKVLVLEREHLQQTRSEAENLCLNIAKASNYLMSLDSYGTLYRSKDESGYLYLSNYKSIDNQMQNVNNSMLNSCADISVLSQHQLLYSTLPAQKFDFDSFVKEQIPQSLLSPSVHRSYHRFEPDQTFISYARKLPFIGSEDFYLVITVPTATYFHSLGTATGTIELLDSKNNPIYTNQTIKTPMDLQEEMPLSLFGWKIASMISSDSLYKDIYQLRTFTLVFSLILLMFCMIVTFFAIYAQLKPLVKLKEQMQLVALGNLNAEVITTNSKDEISSLSNTFNNMVSEIGHLIDQIQVSQKRESELRFEMLLAQINPHFLFNTLNSIKWMAVVAGANNISSTITSLGRLLEISMNKINDVLSIEEELTNIKSYIQIQQVRYPGRFDVEYAIPEELLHYSTLKLILQPIVENSILHNIEQRDFLQIQISGQLQENCIILKVRDNGVGMSQDTMSAILKKNSASKKGSVFSGIGVYNVQERIQLAYGMAYGLSYHSDASSFTEVSITLPKTKELR